MKDKVEHVREWNKYKKKNRMAKLTSELYENISFLKK